MRNNKPSIHRRLLFSLLGTISIIWLSISVLVRWDAAHELEEIYDASLAQNARILFGLIQHEAGKDENYRIDQIPLNRKLKHEYELKIAFMAQIGEFVIQSNDAPLFLHDIPDGFSTYDTNSKRWRIFQLQNTETKLIVRTAQNLEAREELVTDLVMGSLLLYTLALPLLGFLIWWGIGQGLLPVKKLASDVEKLSSTSLKTISVTDVPSEVAPLIRALNSLLERLGSAMVNERRFTADAAHELRTPLAALKVQIQVAQRALNPNQQSRALTNSIKGVDRATHLVEQLLYMARAESDELIDTNKEQVDLADIVAEMTDIFDLFAHEKQIQLNYIDDNQTHVIHGHNGMLQIAIRNILDNAIRYSPPGSSISIELQKRPASTVLTVTDNGPGIPQADIESMFKRFKRGSLNSSGSGLGLSIVKRTCDIHQASISLVPATSDQGGLKVSIEFKS